MVNLSFDSGAGGACRGSLASARRVRVALEAARQHGARGLHVTALQPQTRQRHLRDLAQHYHAVAQKRPSPAGYAYYLRDRTDIRRLGNAFVIGDAAGLATRDMAEGIGPAVRSGIQAANAIADGADYAIDSVAAYSLPPGIKRRALEYLFVGRGAGQRRY